MRSNSGWTSAPSTRRSWSASRARSPAPGSRPGERAAPAFQVVHPGAVYLHQGETYLVERLDLDARTAYVQPVTADYYTTPRVSTTVRIVEQHSERLTGSAATAFGEVWATRSVLGYR